MLDDGIKVVEITNQSGLTSHELRDLLDSKIPKGYRVVIAIDAIPYKWVAICVKE